MHLLDLNDSATVASFIRSSPALERTGGSISRQEPLPEDLDPSRAPFVGLEAIKTHREWELWQQRAVRLRSLKQFVVHKTLHLAYWLDGLLQLGIS